MALKENKIWLLIIISFLLVVSVGSVIALSGAIGNSVMIIETEVNGQDTVEIERTILVLNRNDETINVTLVADQDAEDFIEVIDENFFVSEINLSTIVASILTLESLIPRGVST